MKNFLETLQIPLNDRKSEQLETFVQSVLTASQKFNLTGWKTPEEIWRKGIFSSIYWLTLCPISLQGKAVDIGSGAGFPGIPLKILYPEVELTCVESIKKKSQFIQKTFQVLGLKNVQAISERSENLAHLSEYREKFDFAFTRALGGLRTINELSIPFLRIGGSAIHLKGTEVFEEVCTSYKGLQILGGWYSLFHSYTLPGGEEKEVFVKVYKEYPTPEKYPRRPGIPFKKPL